MRKEYIRINEETYNKLAKEYQERNYIVKDDFYIHTMFRDLDFKKGKKILEIGPGRGDRLKNFCDYHMDVTAIELSKEMCKLCIKKAPKAKIIHKNVLECDFNTQFDFIYIEAMIHNFPLEDAKKVLKLVSKWLKDTGILICTTTIEKTDSESYIKKLDYKNQEKRFRHCFTEESFNALIQTEFTILNKKYKKEQDEVRNKTWQIIYAEKKSQL